MQKPVSDSGITQRLELFGIGIEQIKQLKTLNAKIVDALPGALERFYKRVKATPQMARFFSNDAQMHRAKQAQISHWAAILSGEFDASYEQRAITVGQRHAQIGLEPALYVGGYATVLEDLIGSILGTLWRRNLFNRNATKAQAAAAIGAVMKAALMDIELSTSAYISALEEKRLKLEAEIKQQQEEVSHAISSAVTHLAQKNLAYRIEEPLPESYAQLRAEFNSAVAGLSSFMTSVRNSASTVRDSSTQIARSSDNMAVRSEKEASALHETTEALRELASAVSHAAENTSSAEAAASRVRAQADEGGQVVKEAIDAMGRIDDSSKQIVNIISAIDEISFQTNILALNAGVEAARAGEAGRGFAVVATEVRSLAQRSAEASRQIRTIVSSSSTEIANGVTLVNKAGATLLGITEKVGEIATLISDIASTSHEQSTSLNEVMNAVQELSAATQQNAAMVEETTANTHELSEKALEMAKMVSQFRTERERARNAA